MAAAIAAAAIPVVASLFGRRPSAPAFRGVQLQDRSPFTNQLLADAFNPAGQNRLFELASQNALQNVSQQPAWIVTGKHP